MARTSRWTEEDKKLFARNLAHLRSQLGWTQQFLASKTGIKTISRYESGSNMAGGGELSALAATFGVTIEDLVGKKLPEPGHAHAWEVAYSVTGDAPPELRKDLDRVIEKHRMRRVPGATDPRTSYDVDAFGELPPQESKEQQAQSSARKRLRRKHRRNP